MAKATKKEKAERGRPVQEDSKRSRLKSGELAKLCVLIPTELRDKLKVDAAGGTNGDMSDILTELLQTRYE